MSKTIHIAKLCWVIILLSFVNGFGQKTDTADNGYVILKSINLEGNKRTRSQIILRELAIKEGDTISKAELESKLTFERNKIFNTQLFNVVDFEPQISEGYLDLNIKMEERWYIWPSANIDFGDRNFNEWLLQRGAKFDRLVYGLTFRDKNFRGRKENVKMKFQLGFTRKLELYYDIPYLNKNQKTGAGFKVSFSDNNTVAWRVNDHKLEFFESDNIQRRRFYSSLYVTRRSQYYGKHVLEGGFHHQWVGDSIVNFNPNYFGDSLQTARFIVLAYSYSWDRRNIAYYPTKGHYFGLGISKAGLGILDPINIWQGNILGAKYYDLGNNFYSSHYGSIKISGPEKQPFFLYNGLGYGNDLLRGFDLFVINGNYYGINKNELKFKFYSFRKTFDFIPISQFKTFPIDFYVKLFADFGYADDRNTRTLNNRFTNKYLAAYGGGLDIATFYDLVFRLEYSINQDLEDSFFLNLKSAF